MARVCGTLIAVGYFLPWVDVIIISFSGYNIGKIVGMAGEFGAEEVSPPLWVYGTYFFPVLGDCVRRAKQKGTAFDLQCVCVFDRYLGLGGCRWSW